ncbi:MAG TPA: hypothetical protein VF145_00240 [Chitinophagaceae bacterium]
MKQVYACIVAALIPVFCMPQNSPASEYKLKQVTTMTGMKIESTVYVKKMRKRTETAAIMGMGGDIATIEQCDLRRTIRLNDKKKVYIIVPFTEYDNQTPDERPAKERPPVTNTTRKGGVISIWYNITDTGERKKMYGFVARHVWTSQKMKPSPDACNMKDSMQIRTDGWYIDLPEFNCPVETSHQYRGTADYSKPDCMDRFVMHSSGKGRLGFPLIQTTWIIMGDGSKGRIETSIETLEFSTAKLDSMLFTIPPGYNEVKSEQELMDAFDANSMLKNLPKPNEQTATPVLNEQKAPGKIRIGIYPPAGNDEVQPSVLQQQMVASVSSGRIEAVAIATDEEARKYNCDYTITTLLAQVKSTDKVGGLIKAIRKADPRSASNYAVQGKLTLKKVTDGTVQSEKEIDGKYSGRIDEAAGAALAEGSAELLKAIR